MHDDNAGPSQRLAAFVADTAHATAPLPAKVAEKAACCLLDALGLALLARDEPTARAMAALSADVSNDHANGHTGTIWNTGRRVALADAVGANAAAVHAQFHDDTDYSSWTHPGSLIVPVALTRGESINDKILFEHKLFGHLDYITQMDATFFIWIP